MITSGSRLGPYEIVAPIGAGGMGEVFKARDTRLDRSVAIKVVSREFAQRFEREAKAISALNHPNICTLYDVGHENGTDYLVMELLEGEPLADRLTKGALPLDQTLRYGAQVADALDRAHRAGIVHRDLKPGNVVITKSGAKLLDFGLAKPQGLAPVAEGVTVQKPITEEGTVLGTFQYMAPEQIEGQEADARTDIFALGAVLYEMATGKRAFDGKTRTSLIAAIVSGTPRPISEIEPLTPASFEHVVQKCLAKDPDDRWQSAHDVATELQWVAHAARPAPPQRRWLLPLAFLALVPIAFFAGAIAFHSASPQREIRFSIPMYDRAYSGGTAGELSSDGKTVYFRAIGADGIGRIYKRRLSEAAATPIAGTEDIAAFSISPDQRWIGMFRRNRLERMSLEGGPAELVYSGVVQGGDMMSDGRSLIVTPDGTISIVRAGEQPRIIARPDPSRGETFLRGPIELPDHKHFMYVAQKSNRNEHSIVHALDVGSLDGREPSRKILDVPTRAKYAAGNMYFVRDGVLLAQPFDLGAMKAMGEATPVAEGVSHTNRTGAAQFDVAADGTIVFQSSAFNERLTWVDMAGRHLGTVGKPGTFDPGIKTFTPDGSAVLVATDDPQLGMVSIWSYGIKRDTATRVTSSPAYEAQPVLTPDGSRMYFQSDGVMGTPDIYSVPIDGSEAPRLELSEPLNQWPSSISPDGKLLFYVTQKDLTTTSNDIYALRLDGSHQTFAVERSPGNDGEPRLSPDGKWLSFVSNRSGKSEVYVRPFPAGSAKQISVGGGLSARWSPDGRSIYYRRGPHTMLKVAIGPDGTAGEPQVLFEESARIITVDVAPSGDRFLMQLREEADTPPLNVIVGWKPPHS